MVDFLKHAIDIVHLKRRYLFRLATGSFVVYLVVVVAPQQSTDQYTFVGPTALFVSVFTFTLWFLGLMTDTLAVVWKRMLVPAFGWVRRKVQIHVLKRNLLRLTMDELVLLSKARHDEVRTLFIKEDEQMAHNLRLKGVIVPLVQKVTYEPNYQIDELAWTLVMSMLEFKAEDPRWLEAISMKKVSLESAVRFLPQSHPTVAAFKQRNNRNAGSPGS